MPWMMKLYFLGLFLSLLSALFSLLDFLGQLMPLHPMEPSVTGQWMEPESRNPVDGPPGDLMGDVTKKGKWVDITNTPTIVVMGVTSSDPCLPLPNVLLMGKHRTAPLRGSSETCKRPAIELTRMLPLRYVRLSTHNAARRILQVRTVTQKVYYLQLHQEHPWAVFVLWSRLANILQRGLSITTKDPSIRIRHSLVPSSSSSPSSGHSSAESQSVLRSVGRKMSGVFSQVSGATPKRKEKRRKVSFQADTQDEVTALSNDIRVLFYDMPPPLMCMRCKGRLPKASSRGESRDSGSRNSDLDLLPWMEDQSYGLWQQETPSWLQPLCRLSSLAAAGYTYSPP